ncbi:MAG: GntR family transcriptional regulator [Inquilinaceae bacterium]
MNEVDVPTPRKLTAEEAYLAIREQILAGEIRPGDHLRETELAARLGLSRTPVREALRRLEADGLLVHEPHRGAMVAQLDYQAVTELYLIREVLEGTAAASAAQHASEAEIATLQKLIASQQDAGIDPAEAARLNQVFHRAIHHGAHNRYVVRTLDGLGHAMALLGRTTLSLPGRQAEAQREHEAILNAIAARDAVAADRAAREHIRAAHRARLQILLGNDE